MQEDLAKEYLSNPKLPQDLKHIIQTQLQMRQIILKLAVKFWNRNESHTNLLSRLTSSTTNSTSTQEEEQRVQAVHTANKLAHLLLDSKEYMLHGSVNNSTTTAIDTRNPSRYPPTSTHNHAKHNHFVFLNKKNTLTLFQKIAIFYHRSLLTLEIKTLYC